MHTTPNPIKRSNSCLRIIAVTMSVTCLISKSHCQCTFTHLELVEAENSTLGRETASNFRQRIFLLLARGGVPRRDLVLPLEQVHHERMEMYPGGPVSVLAPEPLRQGLVEEVHEHRLAGPDRAVEVQSFRD